MSWRDGGRLGLNSAGWEPEPLVVDRPDGGEVIVRASNRSLAVEAWGEGAGSAWLVLPPSLEESGVVRAVGATDGPRVGVAVTFDSGDIALLRSDDSMGTVWLAGPWPAPTPSAGVFDLTPRRRGWRLLVWNSAPSSLAPEYWSVSQTLGQWWPGSPPSLERGTWAIDVVDGAPSPPLLVSTEPP